MKKSFYEPLATLIFALMLAPAMAQNPSDINAYTAEDQGYFTNPTACSQGILLSDNYDSKIWLLKDGQLTQVVSTPACGRYFSVSEDGQYLAYKEINAEGLQSPVQINLNSGATNRLAPASSLCGQPVTVGNTTAFTIGNDLHIRTSNDARLLNIGFYTNFIRLSPTSQSVVYNDDHDRILVMDLVTGNTAIIAGATEACFFPQWSPDANMILYTTSGQQMRVYNVRTGETFALGYGVNPHWAPNSHKVIFHRIESKGELINNADVWISNTDGTMQHNITNTAAVCEMDASYISESEIIFHTFVRNEICKATIDASSGTLVSSTVLYAHQGNPDIAHYNTAPFAANKAVVVVPGSVPYIHQVYDTPDWHYGYGSCAPTTAMMALAYFNKLPKWPITSSSPTSHTSDYGSYVADKYRFNEIYYSTVSATSGGEDAWGGYGYMWGGSCSPNSCMNQYMVNHQMGSTEYWTTSCKWDSTVHEIVNGWPQPICSMLTTSGHLTLAIGYIVGQHTLIFKDPYGNKNSGYMNYLGDSVFYDWPGYSNGFSSLNSIAWTVQARATETTYNDTLIDDIYYNHGFYMNNTPPSLMRYYRDETGSGYNNHYWYTISNPSTTIDTCLVRWTPNLSQRSLYEVFAYIPSTYATATNARYKVYYDGGSVVVNINQNSYSNQWVSLGTYVFNAGNTGYVQLGDGSGTQGQYIAFDAMRFHKIGAIDNTNPTVAIQAISGWKTTDFVVNYTDSDNAGGSGVESSYYQVLEYNSAEWRANAQNGFFNDNFTTAIHPDWSIPAASGSWSISSGHLRQTDQAEDNSNIYAPLAQNNSNEYLYEWSATIDGSGTTRRSGLHFFVDNPTLDQRGNSYLVWFRADNDQVQIYKTVSNALVLKTEVPLAINTATWYDFKVTYNPVFGRIEVFMDGVPVALFIDPSPLQSGSYISLRNGNADVMFDDVKVRRLRSSSTNVSVGTAATKDVRYQNTNPATPACRINTIVKDLALHWSAAATTDVNIDWTSPSDVAMINDGNATDIDTLITQTLSSNWSASADPHSGVAHYYVTAGTTSGASDVIGITDNALLTSFSQTQTLVDGQLYYFSVYAENGAGLLSGITTSDGQRYLDVTGLSEENTDLMFTVFPNPMHNECMLTLSLEQAAFVDIKVLDMTGRCVLNATPGQHTSGLQMIRLNVGSLRCGSYLVQVNIGDKVVSRKIAIY